MYSPEYLPDDVRITFTPAERALIVEKAEEAKVMLNRVITSAKTGDTEATIRSMALPVRVLEDFGTLVAMKLRSAVEGELL